MAQNPRSSFIPKETSGVIPMQIKKRRSVHVFSLLSTVVFLASLGAAIGMYFYSGVLENRLEAAKVELSKVDQTENDRKIEEIRIYNEKLKIAENLLDNHLAASSIFEEIENSTKVTVQYDTLKYTYDPGFEAEIVLDGNTANFSGVALQKMQLIEDVLFSDFIVRDITTQEDTSEKDTTAARTDGKVGFTINGLFQKNIIEYTGEGRTSVNISAEPVREAVTDTTEAAVPTVDINEDRLIPPQI